MNESQEIIDKIESGLSELEQRLSGENIKRKKIITERAKKQLQKAKMRALVKGDITTIDLVKNDKGQAWAILHDDNGNKEVHLYYFVKNTKSQTQN